MKLILLFLSVTSSLASATPYRLGFCIFIKSGKSFGQPN